MSASLRAAVVLLVAAAAITALLVFAIPSPRSRSAARSRPAAGGSPGWIEPARAPDRDLRLPPSPEDVARGGVLRGKILVDPAHPPLPSGIEVRLRPSRFIAGADTAASRDLAVAADLTFAVEGLPFGAYELRAMAKGWNGVPSELQLSRNEPSAYATIRCVPAATLTGIVFDSTRAPIDRIRVELAGADELGAAVSRVVRTAADGAFVMEEILDGHYTLAAGPEGAPLHAPVPVRVSQGAAPFARVEVPALGGLDVTVVAGVDDLPIEGFAVTLLRVGESELPVTEPTGPDGTAVFRNLRPGKYSVQAMRDYYKRVSATTEVAPGPPATVRVQSTALVDGVLPRPR